MPQKRWAQFFQVEGPGRVYYKKNEDMWMRIGKQAIGVTEKAEQLVDAQGYGVESRFD